MDFPPCSPMALSEARPLTFAGRQEGENRLKNNPGSLELTGCPPAPPPPLVPTRAVSYPLWTSAEQPVIPEGRLPATPWSQQAPPLPHLRVAEVMGSYFKFSSVQFRRSDRWPPALLALLIAACQFHCPSKLSAKTCGYFCWTQLLTRLL